MSAAPANSSVEKYVSWIYSSATFLLVVWFLLSVVRSAYPLVSWILVFSGGLFALGLAITAVPIVKKLWANPLGALAFAVANFVVLLAANAMARTVLTSATGLPGQDFDWAVSMLSVLLYIPAAIAATSVVLGPFAIFGQVVLFVGLIGTRGGNRDLWRLGCHVAGAIAGLFLGILADEIYKENRHLLNPLAVSLAAAGDYQAVNSYPGIIPGTFVVFHENGVVSAYDPKGGRITIRKLE